MKKRKIVTVLIGMLLLCIVSSANAAEVQKYVWGSGPMGGLWRIGVGAAVQLINEQHKDKYFYTAAASGGGVENVRRMIGGEFDTTWAHSNIMEEASTGTGMFEGQKPFKDMRVMVFMGDQAVCVIALAKSPIKSFSDLAGKKVNVGAPGGIGVSIAKSIFKSLGIEDKVKLSFLNPEGAAQGLKDGHIDAALAPGSPFTPSFVELSRSSTLRLVEPTKVEEDKIEKTLPYMDAKVIAPNTAPGENADKPRRAFFWGQYWVALPRMPDQAVYDALKVTQDPKNKAMLTKVMSLWGESGPVFGPVAKMGMPLHPGAIKYWQEKGVKLPPELLK
ncbi:MAG: TAXI family TRAP transporter solute-binding subunit [Rectinemataceae bacterium]